MCLMAPERDNETVMRDYQHSLDIGPNQPLTIDSVVSIRRIIGNMFPSIGMAKWRQEDDGRWAQQHIRMGEASSQEGIIALIVMVCLIIIALIIAIIGAIANVTWSNWSTPAPAQEQARVRTTLSC